MCRTLSNWRLYSWMRLIWLSKMESGSTDCPVVRRSQSSESGLGRALGLAEAVAEAGVVGQGHELLELAQVGDPAVADRLGDQPGQVGIGQQQPAPRASRRWSCC